MATQTKRPRGRGKAGQTGPTLRRFSVDEYERMIEAGILRSGERVELVEGEIRCMAAMGARHLACISRANRWFIGHLPRWADVRIRGPVRLPPHFEPEPDIAIVHFRDDAYESGHPGSEEVLLLIEVSDTSLAYDRDVKLPLYAAAGIREVWIVDLTAGRVLVYRTPQAGRYSETSTVGRDGTLAAQAFPGIPLPLTILFGEAAH